MFADLSLGHILIIMLIVMLVFGSKRLPEMGASMGKGIREFKRSLREVQGTLDAPDPDPQTPRHLDAVSMADGEPKKLSE